MTGGRSVEPGGLLQVLGVGSLRESDCILVTDDERLERTGGGSKTAANVGGIYNNNRFSHKSLI